MASISTFSSVTGRQYPREIVVRIKAADWLVAGPVGTNGFLPPDQTPPLNGSASAFGTAANIAEMPAGAIIVGGQVSVIQAVSGGTISASAVSLGDSASATRYVNALSAFALGGIALSRSDYVFPATGGNTGNLKLLWTLTGSATLAQIQGEILIAVRYVIPGSFHEVQGI